MEVYLQESCASHCLIQLASDWTHRDIWWDGTVGCHSSEKVLPPVSSLWGRCVPRHLCSHAGPSTYSLAAPNCRIGLLHSVSHSWALQQPATGDLWEHLTPPSPPAHLSSLPKKLGKSEAWRGAAASPSQALSPALQVPPVRISGGLPEVGDSIFPLAVLLQGILCGWLKSTQRTSPLKV